MEESIYEIVKNMPPKQELDNDTQKNFLKCLSIKLQQYSNYNTGWSDSIFKQFYEDALKIGNISFVTKEIKAYLNYFTVDFVQKLAPCFCYIKESYIRCSYKDCKSILENIINIEKTMETVSSLEKFNMTTEGSVAIFESIQGLYNNVYCSDYYSSLLNQLCRIEINRIEEKYTHRQLPLISTDIEVISKAVSNFEESYETALTNEDSLLANSIRIKLVPIVNELVTYARDNPEDFSAIKKVVEAIESAALKCRKSSMKKRKENLELQLSIDLELLKQISDSL